MRTNVEYAFVKLRRRFPLAGNCGISYDEVGQIGFADLKVNDLSGFLFEGDNAQTSTR